MTIFSHRRALVRALASGRVVLSRETGCGWQLEGGSSLNHARKHAATILAFLAELSVESPTFTLTELGK